MGSTSSISYFLRTSRMYDTLMQMGRWFGYRPGYLDLCRLFTTGLLSAWYRHIALADAELRREFDYMVAAGLTPEQYGLRVRTHPGGMTVTALNKMCHSKSLELSWAGVLVQTTQLPRDAARITANVTATEKLLSALGQPTDGTGRETRIWRGVSSGEVAKFVESLQFPPESARASGQQLANFIRQQVNKAAPELNNWTIALASVQDATSCSEIGGLEIGLAVRAHEQQFPTSYTLRKANLLSPDHEALDFKGQTFDQEWFDAISDKFDLAADVVWLREQVGRDAARVALDLTVRWQHTEPPKIRPPAQGETKRANGRVLRVLRRRSHGLLIIYPLEPLAAAGVGASGPPVISLSLSFPTSDTVLGVEYRVNRVWGAEMQEDDQYDNDN